MRIAFVLALHVVVASAVGCGDDIEGETLIGATCESSDDCDVTGICVKAMEGLCTLPCEHPGKAQECPLDSFCDVQRVETDEDAIRDRTLCFPACTAQRDCREGYECNEVSSGSGRVCVPKN